MEGEVWHVKGYWAWREKIRFFSIFSSNFPSFWKWCFHHLSLPRADWKHFLSSTHCRAYLLTLQNVPSSWSLESVSGCHVKKNCKHIVTDLQKRTSGIMYFTGKPSLHQRTDALTFAFGSFPGASQGHALPVISVLFVLVCAWETNLSLSCRTDIFPSISPECLYWETDWSVIQFLSSLNICIFIWRVCTQVFFWPKGRTVKTVYDNINELNFYNIYVIWFIIFLFQSEN